MKNNNAGGKIEYLLADPSGNITLFVLSPVQPAAYMNLAERLLADCSLNAEQVGFLLQDDNGWRLQMAGGEFCGNASRCFAAWLVRNGQAPEGKDFSIHVSGCREPLTARVWFAEDVTEADGINDEADNKAGITVNSHYFTYVTVSLPQRIRHLSDTALGNISIVEFDGITHVVLWKHKANERSALADLKTAQKICRSMKAGVDCLGLLYYDENEKISLRPLVYVESINSLRWENSCGSGTCALAAAMFERDSLSKLEMSVSQPGGSLKVEIQGQKGILERIKFGGPVIFTDQGTYILE